MSGTTSTTTYGVTPTGFVKMRQLDCMAAIVTSLNAAMVTITGDPTAQVDTRPDTVFGQIIATFAEREATLWEMAEALYNSFYPVSASGISLDNAVTFSGVTRQEESQTIVYATMYGDDGTLVQYGAQASLASTGETFSLSAAANISSAAAVDVTISVVTILVKASYTIIINNITYTYVAQAGDGFADIIAALASSLALSGLNVDYSATTSVRITSVGRVSFSISTSSNLSIDQLGSIGEFVASEYGPISVAPGDLSQIGTVVSGWTGITNAQSGITGQYQETDASLRTRYALGVYQLGASILPAIQANLQDKVPGVTAAYVIENATDTATADGQSPHSIQCVVQGGDDLTVAQQILLQKPAGIATYGTTAVQVELAAGGAFIVNFTRPQPVYVWLNIRTFLLDEESFPSNGLAAEGQAVVTYGNSLSVGQDVVLQRFYGPIYTAVSGIAELTITVAVSLDPNYTPVDTDYTANNASIGATQIAVFDISRVSVS